MKAIFILILLTSQFFISKGQEKYSYEFEKLETIDTIDLKSKIDTLLTESNFISDNYFISEDQTQITLVKKTNKHWVVYQLPFEKGVNLFYDIVGESEDKKYLIVKTQANNIARGTENTDKELYIVDLINNSYTSFETYSYAHFWEYGDKDEITNDIQNLRTSEVISNNNKFIVLKTCYENLELVDCGDLGGEYEIQNQKVKKIKNYDKKSMQLKPIQYAGDIAIGMTFEDIKLIYPNVRFEEVSNKYGSCADDDAIGFEIWNENNELMMFVIMNGKMPNRIRSIVVTSPKFSFKNINTGLTVDEVFRLYPKANFRLDSLTDWEHLFIQELSIELVFKTQENNRIAIYKDEDFVKLKRKNAKIDFIRAD